MGKSSYIRLTSESKQQNITLSEIKDLLQYYCSMLTNTGKQLGWDYTNASFPYEIREQEWNSITYLLLQGHTPESYHSLLFGVVQDQETNNSIIQITLTPNSTFGDKSKANEFVKFLSKKLKGELHLFNERVISYNKMKV